MSGGTLVSQIISLFAVLIISRLYEPAQLGTAAFFIAIASVLSPLFTCKYDFAIFSPKENKESIKFFFGSILINLFLSLFTIFSILLISFFLNYNFKWYLITVFLSLLNGLDFSLTAWFNRNKEYRYITIARILRILILNISIILFGLWNPKPIFIVLSNVIGLIIFNLFLSLFFKIKYHNEVYFSINEIIQKLRNNLDFPRYSLPASIINILSAQSPVIILKILFGEAVAGVYTLVNRVMGAPSQLIAGATGEVYRQKASSDYSQEGNCYSLFLKTFKGLFLIATVPFIVVVIFGPSLFFGIFGEQWIESGYFARYLAIFFLLRFCVSPLSFTLIIANRQNYNFSWQVFLFINTTVSMMYGYILEDYMISVIAFSLVYSIMYILYFKEIASSAKGNIDSGKN